MTTIASPGQHGKGGANRILLSRDEQALCCHNAARNHKQQRSGIFVLLQ